MFNQETHFQVPAENNLKGKQKQQYSRNQGK